MQVGMYLYSFALSDFTNSTVEVSRSTNSRGILVSPSLVRSVDMIVMQNVWFEKYLFVLYPESLISIDVIPPPCKGVKLAQSYSKKILETNILCLRHHVTGDVDLWIVALCKLLYSTVTMPLLLFEFTTYCFMWITLRLMITYHHWENIFPLFLIY